MRGWESGSVWILESDPALQRGMRQVLEPRWDLVFLTALADCEAAIEGLKTGQGAGIPPRPLAVLLELALPDGNSFRRIIRPDSTLRRGLLDEVPWMVVSATSDLDTIRACLANGAADYLTRPYRDAELLFRVERWVSRHGVAMPGDFEGALTPTEKRILETLASARGSPVSRADLLEKVWRGVRVSPNGLDVHLFRLRGKIADRGWTIEARKGGEGWILRQDAQA